MDVAWVKYAHPGRPLWHQRLLLAPLECSADEGVVLTPDGDLYVECLDPSANDDIEAVAWEVETGVLPSEVGARNTYGFGALPPAPQLAEPLGTAERLARAEELLRRHRREGGRRADKKVAGSRDREPPGRRDIERSVRLARLRLAVKSSSSRGWPFEMKGVTSRETRYRSPRASSSPRTARASSATRLASGCSWRRASTPRTPPTRRIRTLASSP